MITVGLTVNGRPVEATVEPRTSLADFLREHLNLTGSHLGCEHGVCGACTLIVDGQPVRGCITFAAVCDGAEVTTIEGLDGDEIATQLREAFRSEHALQCGFCTPGMMVSARDIVLRMPDATEDDIRVAMSGNLCRCTGYVGIVRAIQGVIDMRRGLASAQPVRPLGPAGSGRARTIRTSGTVEPAANRRAPEVGEQRAATVEADFVPQNAFKRSVTVAYASDRVWDFFGDVAQAATCLPGASLDGAPVDGHVQGRIKVKVGPMVVDFAGVADIVRDEATRAGTIVGAGRDQRSNSSTKGRVAYAVAPTPDGAGTRVDIDIGYTLTGMLAQFSRSGLVEDVANRILAAFVANLEDRLAGRGAAIDGPKEFDAGNLMWDVVLSRIRALFGWLARKR